MVAESCGGVGAERSEAQHTATLAADSKTGADRRDAAALQKKVGCYTDFLIAFIARSLRPIGFNFGANFRFNFGGHFRVVDQ